MKKVKLAADTVNGVFEVGYIPPDVTVRIGEAFEEDLATVKDGQRIFGLVNEAIAKRIEKEYGIEWL